MRYLCTIVAFFVVMVIQARSNDLFFSEYSEGNSNNQAFEIYKPAFRLIGSTEWNVFPINTNDSIEEHRAIYTNLPSASFSEVINGLQVNFIDMLLLLGYGILGMVIPVHNKIHCILMLLLETIRHA